MNRVLRKGEVYIHAEDTQFLTDKIAKLEAEINNCNDLLIHYGFDKGSIAKRIDEVCAGLIDATELAKENQRLRDALEKIANTDTSYAATAGTAYTMREIAKQTLEDK